MEGMGYMKDKKKVRNRFRECVFGREQGKCRKCGKPAVDAHHITDRSLMPHGGYVKQNGIALCGKCHELAEKFHSTGVSEPGYSPEELYALIHSSVELAMAESERQLKPKDD